MAIRRAPVQSRSRTAKPQTAPRPSPPDLQEVEDSLENLCRLDSPEEDGEPLCFVPLSISGTTPTQARCVAIGWSEAATSR